MRVELIHVKVIREDRWSVIQQADISCMG